MESHYSNCREAVSVPLVVLSMATFSLSKALVVLCYTRQVFDQQQRVACCRLSIVLSDEAIELPQTSYFYVTSEYSIHLHQLYTSIGLNLNLSSLFNIYFSV